MEFGLKSSLFSNAFVYFGKPVIESSKQLKRIFDNMPVTIISSSIPSLVSASVLIYSCKSSGYTTVFFGLDVHYKPSSSFGNC